MNKNKLHAKLTNLTAIQAVGLLMIVFAGFIFSLLIYVQAENFIRRHFAADAESKTKELAERCAREAGSRIGPVWENCMFANSLSN